MSIYMHINVYIQCVPAWPLLACLLNGSLGANAQLTSLVGREGEREGEEAKGGGKRHVVFLGRGFPAQSGLFRDRLIPACERRWLFVRSDGHLSCWCIAIRGARADNGGAAHEADRKVGASEQTGSSREALEEGN